MFEKFEVSNNQKYKIKAISNSAIYTKKTNKYLLKLYYLII